MMAESVYLVRRDGAGRVYLLPNGEARRVEQGRAVNDEEVRFALLDHDQLQALGRAISEKGYKAPDTHLIEGKLQATERHLDDMRTLVFKV
jgi:hypothetical protein